MSRNFNKGGSATLSPLGITPVPTIANRGGHDENSTSFAL